MNLDVICWLVLLLIFLVAEAACPIHLVSLWFAVGSLAALLVAMLYGPIWLQITVFLLVSGVLLVLLWPLVRKYLNPNVTKTNLDAVVGSEGLVTAAIDNLSAVGQVKLGAWSGRPGAPPAHPSPQAR